VFFPRRKEGEHAEPGPLTRHIIVNYETLANLFHLPLKDAARELGLCPTTFKKACRCFNLERWPFRKGQSRIPLARRDSTSSIDSSTSTVRASSELPRDCPDPFSAMFSSVAPEGLLQQASTTLDTRSYGEARYAGPAFVHKTFSPLDAPSCIDSSTKGRVFVGVPLSMPEGLPKSRAAGSRATRRRSRRARPGSGRASRR